MHNLQLDDTGDETSFKIFRADKRVSYILVTNRLILILFSSMENPSEKKMCGCMKLELNSKHKEVKKHL